MQPRMTIADQCISRLWNGEPETCGAYKTDHRHRQVRESVKFYTPGGNRCIAKEAAELLGLSPGRTRTLFAEYKDIKHIYTNYGLNKDYWTRYFEEKENEPSESN